MRLTYLGAILVLVACKASAEKCFEARDRASAAWMAAADSARAALKVDDGASNATAAFATMEKLPATLWPCVRARDIASAEAVSNVEYVRDAPDEIRERIATAKQLATLPKADEVAKTAIATATAELEEALPELEQQIATVKQGARPSAALLATAKRIDASCTQLLTKGAALAGTARRDAQSEVDASMKASEAHIAELRRHDELMKEIMYAASQVRTDAPAGAISVPKSLADDPRFAEARKLTQVAQDQCKK
jgi:hypothetical protein